MSQLSDVYVFGSLSSEINVDAVVSLSSYIYMRGVGSLSSEISVDVVVSLG